MKGRRKNDRDDRNQDITARMEDFFSGQIAWLQSVLDDYPDVAKSLESGETADVDDMLQRFADESSARAERFEGLLREWHDATHVDDTARSHVRGLVREAESLSEQVQARFQKGATAATAQAAAMNDAFAKLRRGKVVLEKYRTDAEPRFVDRRV